MARRLDLNSDVGEGFPFDRDLMRVITSANVACGFHAGDPATMREACAWAAEYGVVVGAQPSYRDREGFGRLPVEISGDLLLAELLEQIDALQQAASTASVDVAYIKPHGALYNRAVVDDEHAYAVVEACARTGLPVLGLPGSRLLALAEENGVQGFRECFADRAYDARGHLVARSEPGAVLVDAADVSARIDRLAREGTLGTVDGGEIAIEADSVCVHGDTQDAMVLAQAVRRSLESAGVELRGFV